MKSQSCKIPIVFDYPGLKEKTVLRTSSKRLVRFLLMLSITLGLAIAPSTAYAAPTIDIGEARALPLGSTVTIKGTVTVAAGAFVSSTFDEGFALQDKSGGIYVSLATNIGLQLGDQAEVTGQLQDIFGLLALVPTGPGDIKHKGHGRPVTPTSVSTGNINEATEGRLAAVEGVITQAVSNDLPYGYKFYVDDGSGEIQIFVSASTNIDLSGLLLGQRVRVIGFSGQFDTTYEVQPRIQSDISVLP
jgi:uncharacterized protein YdeI (BOF family)